MSSNIQPVQQREKEEGMSHDGMMEKEAGEFKTSAKKSVVAEVQYLYLSSQVFQPVCRFSSVR